MKGGHLLSWWARTQQLIALSSAEAELNASIKSGIEGIGANNMGAELGEGHSLKILGDSSANIGINSRVGAGKVKHLEIRQMRLQERVRNGDVTMKKAPRAENVSDALTHHWTMAEGEKHFKGMNTVRCGQ